MMHNNVNNEQYITSINYELEMKTVKQPITFNVNKRRR